MDKGLFGWLFSGLLIGAVVFAMVMTNRESGRTGPSARQALSGGQPAPSQGALPSDPVEAALVKLRLVWAALDGAVDEAELRDIARRWGGVAQEQALPRVRDLARRLQAGDGEKLMQEALDTLARESEPVRMRVLEEFGRVMRESGPLREQAAHLLALWARRLLGQGAQELWDRLGF